ncbi:MAG: TIGR03032 family protein [Gomphosphaeria aponina SAG 52.96 = DSM 107014]|uniref:TIGR03032 family protein n=1 Tax=Gomphosphaeria aponina SAG 52.96 = DSM 107014 TaxID=1521640 RepID=A0A941JM32_9CHRO|nr:TIGR03032 family protein [Gomphosphaeria aponina SAG 52.96 = DSM 107014]
MNTSNLGKILNQLGISLLVSSEQVGKIFLLRNENGVINNLVRNFKQAKGLAVNQEKLAVSTNYQVWDLRNLPGLHTRVEPSGKYDACYVPRKMQVTGLIDIKEIAFLARELWLVNSRFSCLCTLHDDYSFVPRWLPPFITSYESNDCCHLNGLASKNNKPKYITALGATATTEGWRENKAQGGIVMDVDINEIICSHLCLPHCPRWYQNQLWVLESGRGSLAKVDLDSGRLETVTQLPGFTRGLDFYGDFAFIGLSQVREGEVFNGISETGKKPSCGVWVVNIQTGKQLCFMPLGEGVEEISAVHVIPGFRFPEILEWHDPVVMNSFMLPEDVLQKTGQQSSLEREENKREGATPEYYLNLGNQAYHQGNLELAKDYYQRCLELNPNLVVARYNLAAVHVEQQQWGEAKVNFKYVMALEPNKIDAINNLGVVYGRQNKPHEAIAYFRKAIAQEPNFPDGHFNLSMTLLQLGEFEEGFAEWEWRWQTKNFRPFICSQPKWDGTQMKDKTIFIYADKVLGDSLQFSRYLPLVAQKCQRVILSCSEFLAPLLETVKGVDMVYVSGELPHFDVYAPLSSLPYIFGTTLATIPADVPYFQVVRDNEQLSAVLARAVGKKIGVSWGGNPQNKNDANTFCPLQFFVPLFALPDFTFYSLQGVSGEQVVAELNGDLGLTDLSPFLQDFADLAAAIASLDLIITIDNAVAHIAGGLAKPVWNLLYFSADWRWMLDRNDSPWYPTMELYRQQQPGDWNSVFRQVYLRLKGEINE